MLLLKRYKDIPALKGGKTEIGECPKQTDEGRK